MYKISISICKIEVGFHIILIHIEKLWNKYSERNHKTNSDSDSTKWNGARALPASIHITMDKSMVNKDSIIVTNDRYSINLFYPKVLDAHSIGKVEAPMMILYDNIWHPIHKKLCVVSLKLDVTSDDI